MTVLTKTTASSRVEGRTLRKETVSSNRNTKLKVLLTKLNALHIIILNKICLRHVRGRIVSIFEVSKKYFRINEVVMQEVRFDVRKV